MIGTFAERLKDVGVAQFADLSLWKPAVGDFVIYNGWWKHWFGVVVTTQPGEVEILHDVIPISVFQMGPTAQRKHTSKLDITDIHRSRGGKYAVIQVVNGQQSPTVYVR